MLYFSPNTSIDMRDDFEQEMNICSTNDLGIYLGFPLCHRKPSKNKLTFIIDKVASKLASWKAKSLNKAGRTILINAALQAIPRYYMHMIDFPIAIKNKLDSLCSNFFWTSKDKGKKNYLDCLEKKLCPKKLRGAWGLNSQKHE